jgi:nitrilase
VGDVYPTVRVAAVQAAPVFLDRERSIAKACDLIREAGANGARMIGFPEGFVPAHPIWFHFHSATGRVSTKLSIELFKNAVEIPGPDIDELRKAARDANAYVVIGVCEKLPNTLGTLYNTQVYIGPDGSYLGKHQKLVPTLGERLVHSGGYGDTLSAFSTEFGPASGLICGENSNPLAVFALTAQHTRVHFMSWPNLFPPVSKPLRARILIDSQSFAQMTKAFVVSSAALVDEDAISMLELSQEEADFVRRSGSCGGSVIVAPDTGILAGQMDSEEGILYADLDLEVGIKMKLRHDFSGHYNRPDIFQVQVNRGVPQIYSEVDLDTALGSGAAPPPLNNGQPLLGSGGLPPNELPTAGQRALPTGRPDDDAGR